MSASINSGRYCNVWGMVPGPAWLEQHSVALNPGIKKPAFFKAGFLLGNAIASAPVI
ncbi:MULTISPECIES: hypothetical protein [Achromobacter]|uniref:hypothetical protein n=1 Tax=Achromobacter TaxID=222 RepID=UPI0014039F31|nr:MULTISPECIES: hypothetical protein [Achromobacter]MBC9908100.1 hypothetical protein [Achromobacter xylosoxidans]MBD0871775.1 hypothetical protein [Achromobacter xylosoxidans]QNP87208.1 hypothetical protein IAG39_06745 [Achromobacter xylosoxidans]